MAEYYLWIKAFHLIAIIAWMAGLLYLPRIFAYHAEVEYGSHTDQTFQVMERKLLRIIMNPAMIVTIVLGLWLAKIYGFKSLGKWFHLKMLMVIGLCYIHGMMSMWRKDFAAGKNKHSNKFYRIMNEVPTLFMMIAVVLVIVKPFE